MQVGKESELEHLRRSVAAVFEGSPVPAVAVEGGRVVFINSAAVGALRGSSADEFRDRAVPETGGSLSEAIRSGRVFANVPVRLLRRDGSEMSAEAFGWLQGSAVVVTLIERTSESEEKFRAIVAQVAAGIAEVDLTGRFHLVNDRFCEITGRSRDELLSLRMQDITHPDDLTTNIPLFRRAVETGVPFVIEKRYVRPDGSRVWVSNSVSAVRDASGRASTVVAVTIDITERKAAEHALRESRQYVDAVVQSSPVPIVVLTGHGLITLWNAAAERVFGWSAAEVVGRTLPFIPADKLQEHREMRRQDLSGQGFTSRHIRRRRKDGVLIDLLVSTASLKDDTGRVTGIISLYVDVTEQRRIEHDLRESEAKVRALVEQSPLSIQVIAPDGRIVSANKAWERMWGVTAEQIADFDAFSDPQLAERGILPYMLRARAGEAVEIPEMPFMPDRGERKGQLRWVRSYAYPVRDAQGSIREVVLVQEDVTDRRRVEEALRESEREQIEAAERLSFALEASGLGDWSWDAGTDVVTLSPRAAEMFGIPAGPHITWTAMQNLIDAGDRERARTEVVRAVETRTPYDVEYRLAGEGRWISAKGRAEYGAGGQAVGMRGVVQDISARKAAEQERTELLQREQEARNTAELLNRVGPALLAELDRQKLVQRVTDIATELVRAQFGAFFHNVTNEQGESYMLYTLSGVPREAFAGFPMPRNTNIFAPTFKGEAAVRSDDITSDPRYGRNAPYHGMPPGHLPVRSYLAVPVVSRDGHVLGGLFFGHRDAAVFSAREEEVAVGIAAQAAIALDNAQLFAQVQESHAALMKANAELRVANADLEQFAYAAAHDLQEPLRMVTSYTQLVERGLQGKLEGRLQENMRQVIDGARRMGTLLSDLLSYTETSRPPDAPQARVDLGKILEQTLATLREPIEETGASVTSDAMPKVRGYEAHYLQLLQNLVANALKYRHPKRPPRIHVHARREENQWRLCVEDNGEGIAPAYHQKIFGVFKRLHGRDIPGTGIGLAICQRVVERAGGRIWVESEPGNGSRFWFTLPAE